MASEAYTGRPFLRQRPGSFATGLIVLLVLGLMALAAAFYLDLDPRLLVPSEGSWQLASEFFGAARQPAWSFEGSYSSPTFWGVPGQAMQGAAMTVVFAAAAISLAILGGLVLGFLGSTSWWDQPDSRRSTTRLGPMVTATARFFMTLMRSVHELVWAVLMLAALGADHLVAVVAIAIPYTGTLAKVFSEMVDEVPHQASGALVTAGATSWQGYLFGQVPQAAGDMTAYIFYRFECSLRSSAVLGFFGFPTLGYYISASFENLHYREVWTYLYFLFALVLLVDWWSGRLRRELAS